MAEAVPQVDNRIHDIELAHKMGNLMAPHMDKALKVRAHGDFAEEHGQIHHLLRMAPRNRQKSEGEDRAYDAGTADAIARIKGSAIWLYNTNVYYAEEAVKHLK